MLSDNVGLLDVWNSVTHLPRCRDDPLSLPTGTLGVEDLPQIGSFFFFKFNYVSLYCSYVRVQYLFRPRFSVWRFLIYISATYMTLNNIKLVSLNVNGLSNRAKRSKVLTKFTKKKKLRWSFWRDSPASTGTWKI